MLNVFSYTLFPTFAELFNHTELLICVRKNNDRIRSKSTYSIRDLFTWNLHNVLRCCLHENHQINNENVCSLKMFQRISRVNVERITTRREEERSERRNKNDFPENINKTTARLELALVHYFSMNLHISSKNRT